MLDPDDLSTAMRPPTDLEMEFEAVFRDLCRLNPIIRETFDTAVALLMLGLSEQDRAGMASAGAAFGRLQAEIAETQGQPVAPTLHDALVDLIGRELGRRHRGTLN